MSVMMLMRQLNQQPRSISKENTHAVNTNVTKKFEYPLDFIALASELRKSIAEFLDQIICTG